jgi:hypothetical protein
MYTVESQLNIIVLKKGVTNPNLKGFMANTAQTNWNIVYIIYGIGNPIVNIIDE